ncbi:unnamed protein product [Cylindrotheca closterium]|uniref:Peptide deformylase n=1 Tax=Cylindrotheca closterium TaxID=2856 RepID=A0AAD2G6G2_9STRA|nr:unnamed protein product [Cylindrotheca closterium]
MKGLQQFVLTAYILVQPLSLALTPECSECPNASSSRRGSGISLHSKRRKFLQEVFLIGSSSILISPPVATAVETEKLKDYAYSKTWQGTSLEILQLEKAANLALTDDQSSTFPMGRWPDPILRRPASPVNVSSSTQQTAVRAIANALRRTARTSGAVGLAAQQCGVNVRMIFVDDPKILASKSNKALNQINNGGTFLLNPRIVARSSELDMQVWNEECLVLPPTFRATVLRDSSVSVEHETLDGNTKIIELSGELARCLQHELDHDRGILITDHVGLNDLESDDMRRIEREGHDRRQALAYSRFVAEPTSESSSSRSLLAKWSDRVVPPVNAADGESMAGVTMNRGSLRPIADAATNETASLACDEACMQERKRIIAERRAMMNQARSNTRRSDVFELSKQRAALYGTKYQGASCPPNVPCI